MTVTTQEAINKALESIRKCCRKRMVIKPATMGTLLTPHRHVCKAWTSVMYADMYDDWTTVAMRDKYALLALAHWLRHCITQLMQKDAKYVELLIDIDLAIGIITNETFTFHD